MAIFGEFHPSSSPCFLLPPCQLLLSLSISNPQPLDPSLAHSLSVSVYTGKHKHNHTKIHDGVYQEYVSVETRCQRRWGGLECCGGSTWTQNGVEMSQHDGSWGKCLRAVEVSLQPCERPSRTVAPILDALGRHVRCSGFDNPST